MLQHLRPALAVTALFTLLLGLAYPLAMTGIAEAVFPRQAEGSLLARADGSVFGSRWIGQHFEGPRYLHGRPSAAGSDGYDASASSGSNLGPLNETLIEAVKARAAVLRAEAPGATIPADAVTASASGLDPDISPEFARLQAPRIAAARGIGEADVRAVIDRHSEGRLFGFVGQPRVNVLAVNADLDSSAGAGVATQP
ncbi:potassium-transporting ATPase subunit KdpC [Prosthecomicrobium pneumaticum]|uniref:Potassium-transporting ATPase KdpC subunit n=1 Tax=Prosthecomicrobium pneumaticum TaxID=81895 RepID=A0A7W9FQU6_9HYPH|nr:potassium-transporting ATPase subunit KdpC [Prosthecomicrobium pneumaticum]MBB5755159.1 K+-transporting ATPase ATPase C chain [Prosthecomicrobium pneumaticum]